MKKISKNPLEQIEYELPDPKDPEKWSDCLVHSYKTLRGFEYDDRGWNVRHYGETRKACLMLLDACGSVRAADACMVEISQWLIELDKPWTIWAIVRHADNWIQKKRGMTNGDSCRSRLFTDLAKRKTEETISIRNTESTASIDPITGLCHVSGPAKKKRKQPRRIADGTSVG